MAGDSLRTRRAEGKRQSHWGMRETRRISRGWRVHNAEVSVFFLMHMEILLCAETCNQERLKLNKKKMTPTINGSRYD